MKFCMMSGLSLRLFLVVMSCALFSAEENYRPEGVRIVHYPPGGGVPFYTIFSDDEEVKYQGLSGPKTKNLLKELREFVLAGYRLHSDIDQNILCDDRAFQAGVRELISYPEPFYSGELRSLFTKMVPLVDKGSDALTYPGRGKKMRPGYVDKWIYPQGFTRQWTVIDAEQAKKPVKYDRVTIICKGEPVVLDGRLQECGVIVDGAPPEGSLLFIKRELDARVKNIEAPPSPTERFLNFVQPAGCTYTGSIIWCREGQRRMVSLSGAQFQRLRFTLSHPEVPFTLSLSMAEQEWWQKGCLWKGYALKHPAPCTVDFSAVGSGSMRSAVCYRQDFVSESLQESLAYVLKEYASLGKDSGGYQAVMGGAKYLSPQHQKLLWTVVEDACFLQKFSEALAAKDAQTLQSMLSEGEVLCVMRQDHAFLKGVPIPQDYEEKAEESLGSAWVKRALHEKKGMGAFKIVAQEEYVGCIGVQIVHRPPLGFCPSYVAFSKTQEIVCKRGLRQETKNLYQELQEFLLAGYHVHAGIDEKDVCDDSFFQAGVRELISHSEPFDSGELRTLFTRIAKFVDAGEGLTLENPGRWIKMEPGYIFECIYPEGATRQWRVVDAKQMKNIPKAVYDRVFVAFAGEKVVLEGRLCERGTTNEGLSERSLLSIKRRKPSRPLEVPKVSVVENFFLSHRGPNFDTAILLYKGGDKMAVMLSRNVKMFVKCEYYGPVCPVNTTMRQLLRCMLMGGFVLKYPARGYVDVEIASTQKVRNVACNKCAFTSDLQKGLCDYSALLVGMKEGQDSHFSYITQKDWDSLRLDRQKLLWTVEEDEDFIRNLILNNNLENLTRGTVFCFIRGEPAILQGVPVSQKHKNAPKGETLQDHWNKNIVSAHKYEGL